MSDPLSPTPEDEARVEVQQATVSVRVDGSDIPMVTAPSNGGQGYVDKDGQAMVRVGGGSAPTSNAPQSPSAIIKPGVSTGYVKTTGPGASANIGGFKR